MRRSPKMLVTLPLALAMMSLAPSASASDVPTYGALPTGWLTLMPSAKIPATIGAHEKVPGMFVALPKFGPETPQRARHVSIVGRKEQADAIRKGEFGGNAHDVGTCLSSMQMSMNRFEEDDIQSREWAPTLMGEVNAWPKSKDNESAGITAVHGERLVEGEDGKATLDSFDAWIDPLTQGARLIARASLPLVRVGKAIGGVRVYAGRNDRDGATRSIEFVVVRPGTSASAHAGTMTSIRQDGNSGHTSGCGHLRMPLLVDAKHGDSAIVIAPIEVASVDVKTEAPEPPEEPAPAKAKPRFRGLRGRPVRAAVPADMVERESHLRDMQIHLSVSQTSRDKEPLVAVSFGWAGRESVQRSVEPATSPTESGSPAIRP